MKPTMLNRTALVCMLLAAFSAAAVAQQTSQPGPYTGVSSPPPNSTIVNAMPAPPPKPHASHPYPAQARAEPTPAAQAALPAGERQSAFADTSLDNQAPANAEGDGTDNGIVEVAPSSGEEQPNNPALMERLYASDPDGDIVHPRPLAPGELGQGTVIRVRLIDRLSTATNKSGDAFRGQVASDVLQDGTVLIPAGSEIDGRVVNVSSGHLGGKGSMDLRPETVALPDGARYRMYAMVSGTPGSRTRVGAEGTITPGSRLKRDSILYGGGVGAGAATGAILGGPVGALAGTIIGATAITAHLLINHPQATLDSGTVLLFTLTEPLDLEPVVAPGPGPGQVQNL